MRKIQYSIDIDGNISSLESKLQSVKGLISKLTEGGAHPELTKFFGQIEGALDKIRSKAGQPIDFSGLKGIEKEANNIEQSYGKLLKALNEIRSSSDGEVLSLLPQEELNKLNLAVAAVQQFSQAQKEATKETVELTKARAEQEKVEKKLNDWQSKKNVADTGANSIKDKIAATKELQRQSKERVAALEEEKKAAQSKIDEINSIYAQIQTSGGKVDKRKKVTLSDGSATTISAEQKKIQGATDKITAESGVSDELANTLSKQEAALKKFESAAMQAEGNIKGFTEELERCENVLKQLEQTFQSSSTEALKRAYTKLREEAAKLGISMEDIPLEPTEQAISSLTQKMDDFSGKTMEQAAESFDKFVDKFDGVGEELKEISQTTDNARDHLAAMDEQVKNEEAFANRIKQFVGAAGAIKFFSDACRQAFATVKELDAVMTEMAMVTELDVGDYWDQMPEYTQRANALGVSISDAYKSATLFYQQGLETNEVIALSNQTLKMAKIAGLDAAEATDRMTAALRGFNMELNEASAQKVADVYSQLAAITASDVDEISTAMTKTASIASSAGMEFETTAAFLSQIIETTRESAETAGTAMKTVIARFQELKKDPADIGEVDGEIVDANKIETALRSVGVALRDSSGQFRDLDDVFLELAEKWDTLDTNTQRYIATIAAGSRQQSRFIAMMSDYGRTQELVAEAQNSAGASQRQYEKNLDSLESKLAKLENAWNEFTTGIMNSDLVKGAVDFLTTILNTLNKVTSGFGKMSSMLSKIGVGLTIFKMAQAVITKFGKTITQSLMAAGRSLGLGLKESLGVGTKVINELKGRADATAKTGKTVKADATKPASGSSGAEQSAPSTYGQARTVEKSSSSLAKVVKDHLAKPFAELVEAQKKGYSLLMQQKGLDAAREFGDGTGTGAEKQYGLVAYKLQQAGAGTDLRTAMGGMGNEISAQALGLNVDNNDFFKQFVESSMGIKTENLKFNTDENGKITSYSTTGMEDEAKNKFQQLVEQWNKIIEQSVNEFQSANQTIDAINDAMAANAAEMAEQKADNQNLSSVEKQQQKQQAAKEAKLKISQGMQDSSGKREGKQKKRGVAPKGDTDKAKKIQAEEEKINQKQAELNEKTNASLEEQAQKYEGVAKAIGGVGTAISALGMGLGALGTLFDSLGLDGFSEGLSKVATILTAIGGVINAISMVLGIINPLLLISAIATSKNVDADKELIKKKYGVIGAWIAEKIAAKNYNSTAKAALMLSLQLIAILAILVAAFVAVVLIVKAFQANSPEGKLKAAEEAAERAAEAADAAAESYKNLKESLEGLDDQYKGLEELTEGTKEWNEAVEEINNSVLKLIDDYPELAKFMTNENGVLKLDTESAEVQAVLQQEQNEAAYTRAAKIAADQSVRTAQTKVDFKNLSSKANFGDNDDVRAVANMLSEGLFAYNSEGEAQISDENRKRVEAMGYTIEELNKFGKRMDGTEDELKEYGDSVRAATEANKAMYEALAANAQSLADMNNFTQEQRSAVSTIFGGENMESRTSSIESELADLSKKKLKKEAQALWGDDVKVRKNKIVYVDENGEKHKLDKEAAMAQIAAAKATEKAADAMEKVPELLKTLSNSNVFKSYGSTLKNLFSGGGTSLTLNELSQLSGFNYKEQSKVWDNLGNLGTEIFGSKAEFVQKIESEIIQGQRTQNEAIAAATDARIGNISTSMSATTALEYAKKMSEIESSLGYDTDENVQQEIEKTMTKFAQGFNMLANTLNTEQYNQAVSIISAMDWSDIDAWDSLSENLREAGIYIPNGQLTEFVELAKETSGAVERIDLEKLNEHLATTQKVISSILKGESQMSGLSKEFVTSLTALNQNLNTQFVENLDGTFTYVGGTIETLIKAINDNAYGLLNNKLNELNTKQGISSLIEDKNQNTFTSGTQTKFTNYKNWSINEQRGYLQSLQKDAEARGYELKDLKIAGLNNEADVKEYDEKKIEQIMADLYKAYTEGKDAQNQKRKAYKESYTKLYFNETLESNVAQFQNLRSFIGNDEAQKTLTPTMIEDYQAQFESRAAVISAQAQEAGLNIADIGNYNAAVEALSNIKWYDEDGTLSTETEALLEQVSQYENIINSAYKELEIRKKIIEAWHTENDYVENLNAQMEASQNKQIAAQKEYDKALQKGSLSSAEVLKHTSDQLSMLNEQANIQRQIAAAKELEFNTRLNSKDFETFNKFIGQDENGAIVVDTKAAEQEFKDNEEMGNLFDEYVQGLKELQQEGYDATNELEDIQSSVEEIEEQGKEGYNSLLTEIHQALIDQKQKAIESASLINDSLNEASSTLNDKLQKQIDDERNAREKEETEKNLANSLSQLAYMQQDTSGANTLQAQELEQQIQTDEQSYQDSLIDQSLQNLQLSNEEAAQQRERQLVLMQAQLDQYAASQESWNQAQLLLEQGLSADGPIADNMIAIFDKLGWFDDKSPLEAEEFAKQLTVWGASALQWAAVTQGQAGIATKINEVSTANATSLANILAGSGDSTILKSLDSSKESTKNIYESLSSGTTDQTISEQIAQQNESLSAFIEDAKEKAKNEEDNKNAIKAAQNRQSLLNSSSRLSADAFKQLYPEGSSGFKDYEDYKSSHNATHKESLTRQSLEGDKKLTQNYWDKFYGDGRTDHADYDAYSEAYDKAHSATSNASPVGQEAGTTPTKINVERWESLGYASFNTSSKNANKHFNKEDAKVKDETGEITVAGQTYQIVARGAQKLYNNVLGAHIPDQHVIRYNGNVYLRLNEHLVRISQNEKDGAKLYTHTGYQWKEARYKTGGLADFTGPAWLDGTPSKPEYVLNAEQTKEFFSLIDILDGLDTNKLFGSSQSNGDNYFDININVESLENDYDVDQMVERIKQIIYEDSMYRNVNTINHLR